MRARWEAVRASLKGSASTPEFEAGFRRARDDESVLRGFETSAGLIEYLTARSGNLDLKDAIYAALVRGIQGRAAWADSARVAVWLGLWGGLDALYWRNLRHYRREPELLVSEICERLLVAIQRTDQTRMNRVAATLVRNVKRDLLEALRRRWDREGKEVEVPEDGGREGRGSPGLEATPFRSARLEMADLRTQLLPITGDDTDLLLAVGVLGYSQREVADRMGIPYGTVRKRYQRARSRARDSFRTAVPFRPLNLRFPR